MEDIIDDFIFAKFANVSRSSDTGFLELSSISVLLNLSHDVSMDFVIDLNISQLLNSLLINQKWLSFILRGFFIG